MAARLDISRAVRESFGERPDERPPATGRRSLPSSTDLDLKARAAWLYHMEGMTQDGVAQVLGITRARVLRLLAAGREDGTVQVRVTSPIMRCVELERELLARYGLERAVVVPHPQDETRAPAVIGAALGNLLADLVADGMTIGLGWGRTLSHSLPSIPQMSLRGTTVVSLLGGLTHVSQANPSEFAWRFADRLGGECYMLAGPVFAPDRATRDALVGHRGIAEVFRRTERLDIALVSVGELSPNSIFSQYGLLEPAELASLERAGAIGDLLCRFIDGAGRTVDHPVNERVLSAEPAQLRRAQRVILASGGWPKFATIRAGLALLKPEIFVTDERTAERLLAEGGAAAGSPA